MRRNTSINIDEGVIESLRDMGYTLTGFTQTAVDVLLSEGFDDFALSLKLRLIEEEEEELERVIVQCESKLRYLRRQLERTHELRDVVNKNYEDAKISSRVCKLIDVLNGEIIMNGYDLTATQKGAAGTLRDIMDINPDFDLARHIDRIKAIVAH